MPAGRPTGTISARPLGVVPPATGPGILGIAWTCIWWMARWWAGSMQRRVPPLMVAVVAADGRRRSLLGPCLHPLGVGTATGGGQAHLLCPPLSRRECTPCHAFARKPHMNIVYLNKLRSPHYQRALLGYHYPSVVGNRAMNYKVT